VIVPPGATLLGLAVGKQLTAADAGAASDSRQGSRAIGKIDFGAAVMFIFLKVLRADAAALGLEFEAEIFQA
jgi:carbonic anhydrase/acetyltransferase-like protein (isoleucine patch superfamily)